MFRLALLVVLAASPAVLGYGVLREPVEQQQKASILFPSEPVPAEQRSCPTSIIENVVTKTELVPTYHTTTLTQYQTDTQYQTTTLVQTSYATETEYQTDYQTIVNTEYLTETEHHTQTQYATETQYQTVISTVIEPNYITETEYQTDYQTVVNTEYLTETERLTSTVYSTKIEVATTSLYITNLETQILTSTVTESVPHYITKTSEVERLVTVTKECYAPPSKGYGR